MCEWQHKTPRPSHCLYHVCCCLQIALNSDIAAVWQFWDAKRGFDQWQGVLRKLYMSAAALVAGWVSLMSRYTDMQGLDGGGDARPALLIPRASCFASQIITVIMNLIWIGFALDTEAAAEGAAPITDPEAARKN